jgi:hypothetical protein
MKGMALDAIHDDLVRKLGKDAVAYSTVTKYARSTQFSSRKEAITPETPDVESSSVDEAILTALAEFPFPSSFPFSSVRELLRRIYVPRSTVHRAPCTGTGTGTSRNQFASRYHIFDQSHTFTAEQKQIRVQMVIKLLQVLSVQRTRQWHDIVTLDESCIYLFSDYDQII